MQHKDLEQYQVFYEELPITYAEEPTQALSENDDLDQQPSGLSLDQVSLIAKDSIDGTQPGQEADDGLSQSDSFEADLI